VINKIIIISILLCNAILADDSSLRSIEFLPTNNGSIPTWLIAGPFDQPTIGFGSPTFELNTDLSEGYPYWGKTEKTGMVKGGETKWIPQTIDEKGYLDFNAKLAWYKPGSSPEKVWYAKAAYASINIFSEVEQDVFLLAGSNFALGVSLNGDSIKTIPQIRNAEADKDTIKLHLKKGSNLLLAKVWNSHQNYTVAFFIPTQMKWGLFARLVDENYEPLSNISFTLDSSIDETLYEINPTFFFKKSETGLKQRIDLFVSSTEKKSTGTFSINAGNGNQIFDIGTIPFGNSRHELYIPEIKHETEFKTKLVLNENEYLQTIYIKPAKKYKMHVMMLSHTDIGYTHPQPVVQEMHAGTLDDVLQFRKENPEFKWTIETFWQLEQFRQSRSEKKFNEVIDLIKEGVIAISPVFANPFTGWISEEEMINSFSIAAEYKNKYGLDYKAVVYNDVPGQSWILPQVMNMAGAKLLVNGINEVYSDYVFQRNLPKAFYWEGNDGSRVINYITETYTEGITYGLERGNDAIAKRLWVRLNKIIDNGYDHEAILVNAAYLDNAGIPKNQYANMMKWNEEFEYPKFISSNLNEFAAAFEKIADQKLPVFQGDWTSNWDVLYQGELKRSITHRQVQSEIASVEKLATINWLTNPDLNSFNEEINEVYNSILHYSGHGSGLEYGYGSPEENEITMDFREGYLEFAKRKTEALKERSMYRFILPEFSFESNGVMIFNPLSWERDAIINLQFPENQNTAYEIVDMTNNKKAVSFQDGYKFSFIADSLPSLGYKKYKLNVIPKVKKRKSEKFVITKNSLENNFYKISIDEKNGSIKSIVSKKSNRELFDNKIDLGFNSLLVERYQKEKVFRNIDTASASVKIVENGEISISLQVEQQGSLLSKKVYTLWNSIDRIDITNFIDLNVLTETEFTEEYGVAFPFNFENPVFELDLLSGFTKTNERLSVMDTDAFSLRRGVAIHNNKSSISWAARDNRVIRVREIANGKSKVLISNLVNNFPKNWNRHEKNEGMVESRYSFREDVGKFKPSVSAQFGWEFSTDPIYAESWYKLSNTSGSYFRSTNPSVIILAVKPNEKSNSLVIHLLNVDNAEEQQTKISSQFFSGKKAFTKNLMDEKIKELEIENSSTNISLKRGELKIIELRNEEVSLK
jgi:alpha-mannosidase